MRSAGGETIGRSRGKGVFLAASALFAAALGACSSSRSSDPSPSGAAGSSASGSGGSAGHAGAGGRGGAGGVAGNVGGIAGQAGGAAGNVGGIAGQAGGTAGNVGGLAGQAGGLGGSGGQPASGGASGLGGGAGETASGGASGRAGGAAGGGGANGGSGGTGSAGTSGIAGNGGSGGGAPMAITGWTFDDNRGPFDAYAVTPPTLGGVVSYSMYNGHPGGCLDATLGFTGANEEIRVGAAFSSPRTLVGKTLSAEVFVRAGWNVPTDLGKIRLYLLTGAQGDTYAEGATIDLAIGGTWNTVTLDPTAPATSTGTVDTSLVLGLGVSILSPDAPPNTTLEVYVDNVLVHDAP